ncbi:hypothetical protein ACO0LG_15980 [Undibacterium sp. Ji42W]|uniref:hypothetical protein n=1 Tax=Undibacterium sp. Ji42W TaxID=3413039 RepID=UPI003BF41E34
MQQQWTERAIKGAKYLLAGLFLTIAMPTALALAQDNHLALAFVHFVFGVIGPIFSVIGIYFIVTRNRQRK